MVADDRTQGRAARRWPGVIWCAAAAVAGTAGLHPPLSVADEPSISILTTRPQPMMANLGDAYGSIRLGPDRDAFEAAGLVESLRPACELAAGDELHVGVVGVTGCVPSHLQAQPAQAGGIRLDHCRARARVPGVEDVVAQPEHVGAVARAHQRGRVGCGQVQGTGVPPATALPVGSRQTARAGSGRGRVGGRHGAAGSGT